MSAPTDRERQHVLLDTIEQNIDRQHTLIGRTDTKAQIVLTAASLLLGLGLRDEASSTLDLIAITTAAVMLGAAIAAALLVVMPRLGGGAGPAAVSRSRHRRSTETVLAELTHNLQEQDLDVDLLTAATQYERLRVIAASKFVLLQIGIGSALGALPPLVFAAAL